MQVSVICPECNNTFIKEFDDIKIIRYMQGENVATLFPDISPEERELYFISHICPTCWDNLFGEEEDKEEELTGSDYDIDKNR